MPQSPGCLCGRAPHRASAVSCCGQDERLKWMGVLRRGCTRDVCGRLPVFVSTISFCLFFFFLFPCSLFPFSFVPFFFSFFLFSLLSGAQNLTLFGVLNCLTMSRQSSCVKTQVSEGRSASSEELVERCPLTTKHQARTSSNACRSQNSRRRAASSTTGAPTWGWFACSPTACTSGSLSPSSLPSGAGTSTGCGASSPPCNRHLPLSAA